MIAHSLILAIAYGTSTPQELLGSANTLLSHQQWAEAAVVLDEYVRSEEYPSPEVLYDLGVAKYNIGEYELAAKAFDDSMASAIDPTLKTYSAFNLGNAVYKQTLASLEGKGTEAPSDEDLILLENAKTKIKQVLDSYRTAITHDPADMDARANGELAWQMLQQLDEMQEQMEEQQQQQEQDEQSADQQKENQEQQDDGESKQDQQEQDGEQAKDEQQQQQNSEQSKDGEQANDEQQQQNKEPQEQRASSDGDLETTDAEMNQAKGEQSHVKDEGERLSEDEANRLLQLIRDKEQQRRKTLAARRAANRVPVEKDW